MARVVLRNITRDNFDECISLELESGQEGFISSNLKSLAEAKVDPALVPLAIYDAAATGDTLDGHRMIGFTLLEIRAGVGFIMRLMIDKAYQRQGYGRAAMGEIIRRLRLTPEAQVIGTSHRRQNAGAAALYRELGFRSWDVPWENPDPEEVYLLLEESA